MLHRLLLAAFALISAGTTVAGAQHCAVRGRVVAASAAIADARITLSREATTATTDSLGRFHLDAVTCGRHEIAIVRIGFTPLRDSVDLTPGEVRERTYTMVPIAQLDTVQSVGDRIEYQTPRLQDFEDRRRKKLGGHFIGEADLRRLESVSMPSILRSRIPGLQVTNYRSVQVLRGRSPGGIGQDPLLNPDDPRSPRGCWVAIYFDGMMFFDGIPKRGELPPDISQVMAMNLSGIEYYSAVGTMPLQFKTAKGNCGTLLLWTRGR